MTTPSPMIDPLLVDRLAGEFATMGRQMQSLGQNLTTLRDQLDAASQQSARPVQTAPAQPMPAPPQPSPQAAVLPLTPTPSLPLPPPPLAHQKVPAAPGTAPSPGVFAPPAQPEPHQPRDPWWERDGVISRLLAVAGAGVTLIGVVMLLVLAAQAGLFGPPVRVVAGAVLSAVLIGIGMRVYGRTGGRVGGIALAATGIAGAYLDVVAVTTIYGWLNPVLGLFLALGIAAAGVTLASRWRSQEFALIVVVGAAALAPFVTGGLSLSLITFLITIEIACVPVQLLHSWPYLHVARTVPVVLALLAALAAAQIGPADERYRLLAAAAVVALTGLASTVLVTRRHLDDVTASAMLAGAAIPLLATAPMFEPRSTALIQGALAAVLLGLAAVPTLPTHTRIAALATGAVAVLQACLTISHYDTRTIALLVVALGFLAVVAQTKAKAAYFAGAAFAFLGGAGLLGNVPPSTLAIERLAVRDLGAEVVIAAALAVAVLFLLVREGQRLELVRRENVQTLWLCGGLAGLYATTAGTVAAGVALAGSAGFIAGHCLATIGWMIAASAALVFGLRSTNNAHAGLAAGLSLTAAALTKLFLFDLATLDGVARVVAFIVVGLLLLAAGTRYARAFAERDDVVATTP